MAARNLCMRGCWAMLASLAMLSSWAAKAQVVNLEPDLLMPHEAFIVKGALEQNKVMFEVNIAPEYYLYRDRTSAKVIAGSVALGELELPPGKTHTDEFFGEVSTYRGRVGFFAPLIGQARQSDFLVELVTQGCADYGVCYPPHLVTLAFARAGGSAVVQVPADPVMPEPVAGPQDNTSHLQDILSGSSSLFIMLAFFNAGLLLAFTPCVLPMVPIILSITTRGSQPGSARAMALGVTFVAGMAVMYTLLGVLTARSGSFLASSLQQPSVLVPLSVLFAILGFVILLSVNMSLVPAGVGNWLERLRGKPGTFPGALGAGAISAIVVSPCVAAPLVGALLFISTTGDMVTGGLALFAMSLGMGVLPLACAAGAGSLLPRAGPFSEALRRLFGFMLLALSVWVLSALVPASVKLIAYGVIGLAAVWPFVSATLQTRNALAKGASAAAGGAVFLVGAVMLVGGLTGGNNELAPLAHLFSKADGNLKFETVVTTEKQYRDVYALAHQAGTFEYYEADWCISCRELEAYTFSDPELIAQLAKYRRIKVDLSSNDADSRRLLDMHGLFGPPAMVLRSPSGRQLMRVVGYIEPQQLLLALQSSQAAQ